MDLKHWLDYCEQLHPVNIDMGLDRVQQVAHQMGLKMPMPVITVAGTNGKGSTCAMLEAIYLQAGYKTAVYTSPHLVDFEERCRIQGEMIQAEFLIRSFEKVESARNKTSLTYFEFTTLAILDCISQSQADVAILEVGLGGRLDAVNIIDADVAIITSIDIDHTEFLGPDRETIGFEKAGIMRTGRPAIVSDPMPPQSIKDHAIEIGAQLQLAGTDFVVQGDQQQWSWQGHNRRYSGLAYPALRGANQLINASGVLAAIDVLRQSLPVNAQAIRNGFAMVDLPGRFQMVPGQPTLVLDVAHNPHAVAVLFENLDAMGFYKRNHLIFGGMSDKDLTAILQKMKPLADHWYFCDLPTRRAATAQQLGQKWSQCQPESPIPVSLHENPAKALEQALLNADPADRIIVFGSFFTVAGVLKDGVPRLSASHLS
jgi:dihydrofolate synthase/folylpolyglutamate synthase